MATLRPPGQPKGGGKQDQVASRMAKLLGLPLSNVNMLIPLIPPAEIERLAGLPDDEFLTESPVVVNDAQRRQFEQAEGQQDDGGGASEPGSDDDDQSGSNPPVLEIGQATQPRRTSSSNGQMLIFAAAGLGALVFVIVVVMLVFNLLKGPELKDDRPLLPDENLPSATTEEPADPAAAAAEVRALLAEELAAPPVWALRVGPSLDLKIGDGGMFESVSDAFTVEFWVEPVAGKEMIGITVAGDDSGGDAFSLSVAPAAERKMEVVFKVPGADEILSVTQPQTRQWMHVAGVMEGDSVRLYLNGRRRKTTTVAGGFPAPANGYRLSTGAADGNAASLVDEVRLSAAAMYSEKFTPTRIFAVEDTTISLLRLEQLSIDVITDAARDNRQIELAAADWVNVEQQIARYEESTREVAFPKDKLAMLESEFGEEFAVEFLRKWASLSNAERTQYLQSIGVEVGD